MKAILTACIVLVGCGDGGPATPSSFNPPGRGGTTTFAGSGADRGSGSDRGGGTTSAIGVVPDREQNEQPGGAVLQACDEMISCGTGAYCNNAQGGAGHCFVTCTLEAGVMVGDSDKCPSGWRCVRFSMGTVPVCRLPCESAATCPAIAPLSTRCSLGYCGWSQATPPPS